MCSLFHLVVKLRLQTFYYIKQTAKENSHELEFRKVTCLILLQIKFVINIIKDFQSAVLVLLKIIVLLKSEHSKMF